MTYPVTTGDISAAPGPDPQYERSAVIDLDAIRHNVRRLADAASPAKVMAVVKADAYGHGAVPVARAALEAGASWLGSRISPRLWRCGLRASRPPCWPGCTRRKATSPQRWLPASTSAAPAGNWTGLWPPRVTRSVPRGST
ncbi:alanine racemase [Arthrobacter sp. Hiyo4]|nr:alanine racemase [Arthrobacter sp. Hiyo4]